VSSFSNSEKEFVHNEYEQKLSLFKEDKTVLVSHYGLLSQEVISKIESEVENVVTYLEIPKGPLKKIFFISVETLQNMLIHGQKNSEGDQPNFFIVSKNGVKIDIISANLVTNVSIPHLEKQIEIINSFEDEKALKAYYLEHLENNQLSDKGGAGLGFITIGMKSGNKLKVEFKKINDQLSLFVLNSSISI
jgi:hypothetical protein